MTPPTILLPGMIVHLRTSTRFGVWIRRALGSWGNHDGLLYLDALGEWQVLESVHPAARVAPLRALVEEVRHGKTALRFYWPAEATEAHGQQAALWWLANVAGTPYDWWGVFRLLLKALLGDWFRRAAGWEWANWCTEGVANAWARGAKLDVYHKANPTPLTTEKREGTTLQRCVIGPYSPDGSGR